MLELLLFKFDIILVAVGGDADEEDADDDVILEGDIVYDASNDAKGDDSTVFSVLFDNVDEEDFIVFSIPNDLLIGSIKNNY